MKIKNLLIPSFLVLSFLGFGLLSIYVSPINASAAKKTTVTKTPVKKATTSKTTVTKTPVKKATTSKTTVTKSSVTWAASGKTELNKIANSTVRAAYKAKVENYAIRKKIKVITSAVVKGMHE